MAGRSVTRADVLAAAATIAGRVRRTPLLDGSDLVPGAMLKAELFQHAGSFKVRGVTNRLAAMDADELRRGVIGVSAGNHAAALAWGAAQAGTSALVVMWAGASRFKLDLARSYGATVDLEASGPPEAFARLHELVAESGRVVVHPFDDPLVIAGQGTVGLEILEDAPETDVIVVPTGGGGLVSGIAAAVAPLGVRVVAVEPLGSTALGSALRAGEIVPVEPDTVAGGLDAPFTGENALATAVASGVEWVVVEDNEIVEAARAVYRDAKLACEIAGAAGVAALLSDKVKGDRPTVVVSGGNIGPDQASGILAFR